VDSPADTLAREWLAATVARWREAADAKPIPNFDALTDMPRRPGGVSIEMFCASLEGMAATVEQARHDGAVEMLARVETLTEAAIASASTPEVAALGRLLGKVRGLAVVPVGAGERVGDADGLGVSRG
jgi:hypothetical protein